MRGSGSGSGSGSAWPYPVPTAEQDPFCKECGENHKTGYCRNEPTSMLLWCPECSERHIDSGEFATKAHHTHACQHCGHVWRPALINTVGVQFLPGFKNPE